MSTQLTIRNIQPCAFESVLNEASSVRWVHIELLDDHGGLYHAYLSRETLEAFAPDFPNPALAVLPVKHHRKRTTKKRRR